MPAPRPSSYPRLRQPALSSPSALAHRARQSRGPNLVVGHRHWVVEEDHQPVAREVLERPAVGADEVARRRVVLANDLDELLWLGRLGKGREPAEVEVGDGDIGAVAGKELLALVTRDERGHLRRGTWRASAFCQLDGLEQLRVGDRDRAGRRTSP